MASPNDGAPPLESSHDPQAWSRREWLALAGLTGAGFVAAGALRSWNRPEPARVFVAKNQTYSSDLARTIADGLTASGLQVASIRGKKVLLKPNLVEPTRAAPHMTTHPLVILAAADVFRGWGAKVIVGEGPGHVRDTDLALEESGVAEALDAGGLEFADLNYQETAFIANRGKSAKKLAGFHFPRAVVEADIVVSMPKMKTHHWVGVTAAMKNLYGTIPGVRYGWPKNVLHHNGIPNTVFDINASLPKTIAIVDGIDCMEGDGPIMGSLKTMGLLIMGVVPAAVDATVCRLMDCDPWQIEYLRMAAAGGLGPLDDREIKQVGEPWRPLQSPFQVLDKPHLRGMVEHRGMLTS